MGMGRPAPLRVFRNSETQASTATEERVTRGENSDNDTQAIIDNLLSETLRKKYYPRNEDLRHAILSAAKSQQFETYGLNVGRTVPLKMQLHLMAVLNEVKDAPEAQRAVVEIASAISVTSIDAALEAALQLQDPILRRAAVASIVPKIANWDPSSYKMWSDYVEGSMED